MELSPPPSASVSGLLGDIDRLTARLRRAGEARGIEFVTPGTNPWHRLDQVPLQTRGLDTRPRRLATVRSAPPGCA